MFASTFTFVWGFTYKKNFRADAVSQKISSRSTVLLVFVAVIQTELKGSIEPSKLVRFVLKTSSNLCVSEQPIRRRDGERKGFPLRFPSLPL